jgi:peptide deformylase
MAVLPIRFLPDPVLRRKAKRVSSLDVKIQKLIDNMLETMSSAHGAGLAAPQVGVSLRLVVIGLPDEEPRVLINPEIIKKSGEREVDEGCLSIPGYRGKAKRSETVTVKARDLNWKVCRIKGTEVLAQVLEHEIDHLDGVLYIDKLVSPDTLYSIEPEPQEDQDL